MSEASRDSKVIQTYRARHPKSAALYERARAVIPGGITHDGRHLKPFPIYVERALGPRKWDVDGHELIDYWMGHGALFLGHCHPAVVKAMQEQAARGTHFGASHELEVRWAELVCKLIPSRGDGALHHVRHRGHASRDADRARLHGPHPRAEVPRPLPRLARRRGGRGEPALRRAHVGGRSRPPPWTSCCCARPMTSRRWTRCFSAATWRPSSSSPRAGSPAPRPRSPATSRNCAQSPSGTAWSSSSTRSSPAFATRRAAPRPTSASPPT